KPYHPTSSLCPYTTLFRSGNTGSSSVEQSNNIFGTQTNSPLIKSRTGINSSPKFRETTVRSVQSEMHPIRWFPVYSSKSQRTIRSEEHTSELQSRENLVCR